MQFNNFEIHASPHFQRVTCPKDRSDMVELRNGWFSVVWYCKTCKYPYELKLVKMANVNKENLKKELERVSPPPQPTKE